MELNITGVAITLMLAAVLVPGLEPAITAEGAEPQAVTLRVGVFPEASGEIEGKTEVWLRGAGSWFPNLTYGSDVRDFPDRQIGAVDTLYFYPHGRDEPEIQVPVEISSDMCPNGCPRDMVHLEIWDDRYEAWGATVVGRKIVVER